MINLQRNGEWVLVFVTFIAALGWLFSKEAIAEIPPFGFIGLRFFMAAIILLPFNLVFHQAINIKSIPRAIFTGILQALNLILWILAISTSDSLGEGAFIISLSVLFVPLLAWLLFKEKPLKIFWISLPIAIVGLAFLSLIGGWRISISQIWFLLAAIASAIFFLFSSRAVQYIAVLPLSFIQLFCTGICSLILSLLFEQWPSRISWNTVGWLSASILIATSLRYLLQLVGQKYVSIGNAAIIMILEPVFTAILSVIVYREPMPWNKWLGCLFILLSLLLYRGYIFIRARHIKPPSTERH